ncbi:MAG: hypothetical protein WCF04_15595 [Candidatus Nanopelagicales bacterium]
MGVSASTRKVFAAGYGAVFEAVLRAAALAGMTVSQAEPAKGGLRLQTSRSFASCGEDIEVQLDLQDPGCIVVNARSTLLAGCDDWGKNERNLAKLLGLVDSELRLSQPAPSGQGAGARSSTDPSPSPLNSAPTSTSLAAKARAQAGDGRIWAGPAGDAGPASSDPVWLTLFKDPAGLPAHDDARSGRIVAVRPRVWPTKS